MSPEVWGVMQDSTRHFTVVVDVTGSDPQIDTWLKRLRNLAKRSPDGISVTLHETGDHLFGIKEVKAFFKAQAYKQWNSAAQYVFHRLITNLSHKLVVLCRDCGLRCGQHDGCCRCPDKGTAGVSRWVYNISATKGESLVGWHIQTSSLHGISPDDLELGGLCNVNRQRAIELIKHLTNQ